MEKIISSLNDIVWNPGLVGLLLLAGLFFSVRTRFVQVRRFRLMLRSLFGKKRGNDGISSFEAFCIALSSRVGTGNIVGVATAIAYGGPGAVFWMWVVAFFGASTAFVESTLSQIYKFPHASGYRGGPFSFIERGLGKRWLGVVFAVITIISCGVFLVTVQANGASASLDNAFSVPPLATGVGMALLMAVVVIGGVQRVARVASLVTPLMALGYIIMALVVVFSHIQDVPAVFGLIFRSAFGLESVTGGIIGSTIAMGVKRGIFSNEAGQGTGAIASAAADVPHPAQQGLAQAFSVYVDTLLVCTATALMILTSGTYNILDGTGGMLVENAPELGNNYAGYTQSAVDTVFAGFGSQFVSIAMVFFTFTTIIAYYFYAESSILYLFHNRTGLREKTSVRVLQTVLVAAVLFGAVREADLVWMLGDIGVGLMAWVTVITILLLCPKALDALKDFESKMGKKDSCQ
ncbi:MAG: alanine:cation symporter family protein [Bacteroidales bacterium]|nr:alanine:cation symporter family protein [Bacteroidales bacterium]